MNPKLKIFIYSYYQTPPNGLNENKGKGAYCVFFKFDDKIFKYYDGFQNTTIARLELFGLLYGLKKIQKEKNLEVYLSNGYVCDTLTKGWLEKWKKNNFKGKKHSDLWKQIEEIIKLKDFKIKFNLLNTATNEIDYEKLQDLAKETAKRKDLPFDDFNEIRNNIDNETLIDHTTNQEIKKESICVDASCLGNPGIMEYRGVDTKTKKVIFEMKYQEATNNIGEFLAIVHALSLYKKNGISLKYLYSDSKTAILWVKNKKCKTKLIKNTNNELLFEHIERAENWLINNEFETTILKWDTQNWGEIPADYGRKNS